MMTFDGLYENSPKGKLQKIWKSFNEELPDLDLYLVGGCVRDCLMNLEPKDLDLCTPNTVEEIKESIKKIERHCYDIGEKFGTIGYKHKSDNGFIKCEITRFRTEKYIPGSRKPKVEFVRSLRNDLKRRDFNMNSIAFKDNKFYDPFNGMLDISNKIVHTDEPEKRFDEDPLRILRAIRFSTKYNFNLSKPVKKEVEFQRFKLYNISSERIIDELDKIFSLDNYDLGLKYLQEFHLLSVIFPELIYNIEYVPQLNDIDEIYSFIFSRNFYNINQYLYMVPYICKRLKFSNQRIKKICDLSNIFY